MTMLTWAIILVSFWAGYVACHADERDTEGMFASLAAIPTIGTILYLCMVALGLVS